MFVPAKIEAKTSVQYEKCKDAKVNKKIKTDWIKKSQAKRN